MTITIKPPPMDAWEPGVRAADVPVVEDVEFIPLAIPPRPTGSNLIAKC